MEGNAMRPLIGFFDWIQKLWDRQATERGIGVALIWIYVLTLIAVEMRRMGIFPSFLPPPPVYHFFSIQLAFTLILGLEVLGLIFIIPASLSRSIGKQLEILTLILLRNAFKGLSLLPEPISVELNDLTPVIDIAVSGVGALCVFICLGFYRGMTQHPRFLNNPELIEKYVGIKKLLSLFLLALFIGIAIYDLYLLCKGKETEFFETIYTVLIFADIAMVLIAQRFMPCYYAVFRNSGFVIGTLMMRLALSAPAILCSAIAVFAAVFVLALAWGTNKFTPQRYEK